MKRHAGIKRLIAVLLLLLLLLVGFFAGLFVYWDQVRRTPLVVDHEAGNTLTDHDRDLLFLLAGVDSSETGEPVRTDTLMLVRVDAANRKTRILSIPRDTRCLVMGDLDKINHAHAYGGMEETLRTVRTFLGLDVDYYVEVTYELVQKVIDAAGGVDYEVPEGVSFDWEGEAIVPGLRHFNGQEAIGYLRHRASYSEGDLGRVEAQQHFVKAAVGQVFSPKHFWRYPAIFWAGIQTMRSNLSLGTNWQTLLSFMTMGSDAVEFATVPGTPEYIDEVSYYIPDSEATLQLVQEWFGPYVIE